ncbi:signal peptide peptidase SppA [bacterium]|nr:signal peptide peptidase SppA [bacterium]
MLKKITISIILIELFYTLIFANSIPYVHNSMIFDLNSSPSALFFNRGLSNYMEINFDDTNITGFEIDQAFSKFFGFTYAYEKNIPNTLGYFKWGSPVFYYKNSFLGASFNLHADKNYNYLPWISISFTKVFPNFIFNFTYKNIGNLNNPVEKEAINGQLAYINKGLQLQAFFEREFLINKNSYGLFFDLRLKSGLNAFASYDIENDFFSMGMRISLSNTSILANYEKNTKNNYTIGLMNSTKKRTNLFHSLKKLSISISGDYNFFTSNTIFKKRSLYKLIKELNNIYDSKKTKLLSITVKENNLTFADIYQLKVILEKIRDSGTKVVIYLDQGIIPFKDYYLAVCGDLIFTHPQSSIFMGGIHSTTLYYGNFLKLLKIQTQFVRPDACIYKSAIEPFTSKKPSNVAISDKRNYMKNIFSQIENAIIINRKLEKQSLDVIINNFPIILSQEATKFKLIDGTLYEDEFKDKYLKKTRKPQYISEYTYSNKTIAIVPMEGIILPKEMASPFMGKVITPEKYKKIFEILKKKKNIKAVIIYLNSPGGDSFSSEKIYHYLLDLKDSGKKIYVYMEDVGASGGYYISAAADKIFVNPFTVTGSIGIFAGKFYTERLYNFMRIYKDTQKMGEKADFFSPYSKWSEEDIQIMKTHLDKLYDIFKERVAKGRNLNIGMVDKLAMGKIYSGTSSLKNKLCDRVITFNEALINVFNDTGQKFDYNKIATFNGKWGFLSIMRSFMTSPKILTNSNIWTLYLGD